MRIDGEWLQVTAGTHLPRMRGEVRALGGSWVTAHFLVDTGADRTVLSAAVLVDLDVPTAPGAERISGVGGQVNSVVLQTALKLTCDDGQEVVFRGTFTAFPDPEALDMSILGRDILDRFAVIVDRPGDVICLLGQKHGYAIQQQP
jgi:hypothetical protein